MTAKSLILILGDQIGEGNPALEDAQPGRDVILLAEVAEEAGYVRHNRHKIVLLFAAMRHQRDALRQRGFEVIYFTLSEGISSLREAVSRALQMTSAGAVRLCEPGEYRLAAEMAGWKAELGVPVTLLPDTRFLASSEDFSSWARGRKQLRMEYFYREMRRRYHLLLDADGKPEGDKWNYDAQNRRGWRNQETIPERPDVRPDALTLEVIAEVRAAFADNPGDLDQFRLAVTPAQARAQFDWFCEHALGLFGTYQGDSSASASS